MPGDRLLREQPRERQPPRCRVLAATCALLFLARAASGEPPTFNVDWQAAKLSVTAEKADIVSVLEVVRAKTGLDIHGFEQLQSLPETKRMVSVTFENLLLTDALRALLSGFSYGVVGFFEPKPGTPSVALFISSQPSAPLLRQDEGGSFSQQGRGASMTTRAQDEFGAPIALPEALERPEASPPHVLADERAANGIADPPDAGTAASQQSGGPTAAVTVRGEDEAGAAMTSLKPVEQPRATAPARMLSDERMANEKAERQNAGPETSGGRPSISKPR